MSSDRPIELVAKLGPLLIQLITVPLVLPGSLAKGNLQANADAIPWHLYLARDELAKCIEKCHNF